MKIKRLMLGELGTNCYTVSGEDFAFVVDPADVSEDLICFAKENSDKEYKYILLTHCHIDHILGAEKIKEIWSCPIVIGEKEAKSLENPSENLSTYIFGKEYSLYADLTVRNGEVIALGSAEISVLETPGHTKGGVCYILEDNIFCGDTIFKGTIGRTDFPTSNVQEMAKTLEMLSKMDKDYNLYPGHEEATTLFREKKFNQYMRYFI